MESAMNFTDKVIIITGASSGIGAASAKLFAELGGVLTLVGRNKTNLHNVAKECEHHHGRSPLCILLDLTQENSCQIVVNKTLEVYGKLDILVNCAGKIKISSVFDKSMETFDELMNINLRVPYLLSQLALPHLVKTKGNIVNIGTTMLKRHKPGFLPYVMSKTALECFTKHAAVELVTEGVRINTISPGVTRTNILDNLNINNQMQPEVYNDLAKTLPSGVVIEPKEVATLICVTASGMFPNLNGSDFMIDGAYHMC